MFGATGLSLASPWEEERSTLPQKLGLQGGRAELTRRAELILSWQRDLHPPNLPVKFSVRIWNCFHEVSPPLTPTMLSRSPEHNLYFRGTWRHLNQASSAATFSLSLKPQGFVFFFLIKAIPDLKVLPFPWLLSLPVFIQNRVDISPLIKAQH